MKKLTLILAFASSFHLMAQQEASFTHYMFNTLAVNPAYAGSRDALTVTALHRDQWVGFDGAPKTQTLTIHTPIHSEKIGIGFSAINDKIGITSTTSIYADFAYKIKLGKGQLAMGLKGGGNIRSSTLTEVPVLNEDPTFEADISSKFLPNFGFGLYYSTNTFYAGVSSTKLLLNNFADNTVPGSIATSKEAYHLFLIGGAVFNLSKAANLKLKPTFLVRYTPYTPMSIDLNASLLIRDKFWIGPMVRFGDGFGAIVGFQFNDQLSAGYSYDWSLTNTTGDYNDGSHEVLLRYDFIYLTKKKAKSPRYF